MGLSASRPFAIFGTTGLGWEGHGVSSAGVIPSFVCFFMTTTFMSGICSFVLGLDYVGPAT